MFLTEGENTVERSLLAKVCEALKLGDLTEEPRRLTGGFLHKMYSVFTDKGKYAVKLLNPFIMQRETAMGNYRTAERFEAVLEENGLPVLPALRFNGKKMQETDGRYFYVFDWFDGRALKPGEITKFHAEQIGRTLAKIHALEKTESDEKADEMHTDWAGYIRRLMKEEPELGALLQENLPFLEERQTAANAAVKKLSPVRTICHSDMDPKNVLWCGEKHRVIDLECLGYGDPFLELLETALCWSGLDGCRIDTDLFCAFVRAYRDAGGAWPADWAVLFDANCGRLGWLEYCVQRALGINCSEEERAQGREGIPVTLRQLLHTEERKPALLWALNAQEMK